VFLFNSLFLATSAAISASYHDSALFPLLYSAILSALFGVFPLAFVPPAGEITSKEGFAIVVLSWFLSCVVGSLPYMLWGGEFTLTNAWFESVSGYTTTGSSILTDIEAVPMGLLFWRSATHWIGGIGIIIFVLSVLPSIGRAGMVLYRAEVSELAATNFHYRAKKTMQILLVVYVGLTALETISLLFCEMSWFDAVTHSFATIATGGFSPKNLSIAHYQNVWVEGVIIVFMVLSGIHFGLLFISITSRPSQIWKSEVVRYYVVALAIAVLITAFAVYKAPFQDISQAFRYAAFNAVSLGTSTGFATTDTSIWPPLAVLILIFLTLQCACAGSTSGGIKVDRIVIFLKEIKERLVKLQHPHAVVASKIDGAAIDEELISAGVAYISLYLGIVFVSSLILTALGVDALTAFSGSAATMGNVGPGFGTVGSTGNFSQIPMIGKWVLTLTMLLGRLEIFAVILIFRLRSY
jgi:trk system potassium uptake protein TrkH